MPRASSPATRRDCGPHDYGNLVPQVDADGNDLGGVRDVFVAVPIGTYTGWNLFNRNFFEDRFRTLTGSFIPFAPTRQERLATGDPCPLDRRAVSDGQAGLCCSLQEGGQRPRRPTLPAAGRRRPAGRRSGA